MKKGKFYGVIFLLGILAKLLRGLLYRGNRPVGADGGGAGAVLPGGEPEGGL